MTNPTYTSDVLYIPEVFDSKQGYPYWIVSIVLKDHNNNVINSSWNGAALQFAVANVYGDESLTLPVEGTSGDEVAIPTQDSLLAAIKTWAENQDWNTGYTWTSVGGSSVATPVTFEAVYITKVSAPSFATHTDITP